MNCRYKDKKKYLQIVQDELRLKGETLEEHRKHCKAKPGNCPFEKHIEEADRIASGGKPAKPSFEQTDSKYRKLRNERDQQCKDEKREIGTYDLWTGEPVAFKTGWQVSFQEDTTEDPTHGHYITDTDYDARVERIAKETGSKPYLGYFGKPEVSFYCESREQAMQIARRFNQESIYDWTTHGDTYMCRLNRERRGQDHFTDHQNSYTKDYHGPHKHDFSNETL